MNIAFTLFYATRFGENIFLHVTQDGITRDIPMLYVNAQTWSVRIDCASHQLSYHYSIQDASGHILREELPTRVCSLGQYASTAHLQFIDRWNLSSFPEHFLLNKIWLNHQTPNSQIALEPLQLSASTSHRFEIHVPLYQPHWAMCLVRADSDEWLPMHQSPAGLWQIDLNLPAITHGADCFHYRYGIIDRTSNAGNDNNVDNPRIHVETSERQICHADSTHGDGLRIIHDACYDAPPNMLWQCAGVAIPVFSLRSETALGSGEFLDLKLLGDWAHQAGLSMLQLLPINDSTVNYSWHDQYPYSAISVYALHPQYLSITALPFDLSEADSAVLNAMRTQLNALDRIDFESMITLKWRMIRSIFDAHRARILADTAFAQFIADNDWLKPYAVFCVLRDQFGTVDFSQWRGYSEYNLQAAEAFFDATHPQYFETLLNCFVQYHLHIQLTEAVDYVHGLGIALKGDLPIGIRRHSVDTWVTPELFAMDFQAGAPPDMFSELGQNWAFPLYDWERMRADGYQWWGKRMSALAQYFDAMRIDHVLGFFRIWSVPVDATQGLLGYFSPALGVSLAEFNERGIDFDVQRYCQPFITLAALEQMFEDEHTEITAAYFETDASDASRYQFRQAFNTQRKIVDFFAEEPNPDLEQKLLALHAEVLFIAEPASDNNAHTVYHPRFNQALTQSYQALDSGTQGKLHELYIDYFFVRQESLWREKGLEKLPALKNASDMLICAEDLGLVPACVPDVLNELGITALKIQRAPSDNTEYSDPLRAGYLNVVTTSSHDSSTLRQWWAENPELTQRYFEKQLGQSGDAPAQLTPELASVIITQHLNSPAMLAIFPLQDLLATSTDLAHPDPNAERINNPANPNHRWDYRMSMGLEKLILAREWNEKMREHIRRAHRI